MSDNTNRKSFSFDETNPDNLQETNADQTNEVYNKINESITDDDASAVENIKNEINLEGITKEDILPEDDSNINLSGLSEEQILSYEKQIAELKEQVLRNVAETENVRKRSRAEIEKSNKYAITGFARDMIAVVENLHRAIDNIPEESIESDASLKSLYDGVSMTLRELNNVMERHGITRIYPQGEKFDHNLHQAMVQIDTDEYPDGTIIQVMQAGYSIHDRLLQPAMVGVAKSSQHANSEDEHVNTEA